jgi:hypothetical protein
MLQTLDISDVPDHEGGEEEYTDDGQYTGQELPGYDHIESEDRQDHCQY